jgi:hypothetical protein
LNEPADRSSRDGLIGANRRVIMDAIGVAIAEVLPASSRGVCSDERA